MLKKIPTRRPEHDEYSLGKQIHEKLVNKQLPQMVDWYDPALLAGVGLREVISGTMGAYADQRQMQAATDLVDNEHDLVHRYDYSSAPCTSADCTGSTPDIARGVVWNKANPEKVPESYWVDYIADLGDGFEPTYAMAYLMASESLEVDGCEGASGRHLTEAGRLLMMGGDQCYPTATAKEYQERLINPYNWAFSVAEAPKRKVFAIPGNHDWYDGLTAFDGVFCAARDRMSEGVGRKLGGWRSEQHRSYFAVKMPHNWWIWGADIQLEGHLDDAQKDYFDLISEHMGRDDKVIICLAEPSWLHDDYQNLREIVMLASKTDARICAVLAGDWHHYSRYYAKELGISFITCGGGGAFAHATHSLRRNLSLKWPVKTNEPDTVIDDTDSYEHNLAEERVGGGADFKESEIGVSSTDDGNTHAHSRRARRELELDPYLFEDSDDEHSCYAPHIYPKPWKSRLLSLWNLFFPFKHFYFAMALGVIYWLFSWLAFEIYINDKSTVLKGYIPLPSFEKVENSINKALIYVAGSCDVVGKEACERATSTSSGSSSISPIDKSWVVSTLKFVRAAATKSIALTLMVLGLWVGLIMYVDVSWYKGWPKFLTWPMKIIIGTVHTLAHIMAIATLTYAINFVIASIAFAASIDPAVAEAAKIYPNVADVKDVPQEIWAKHFDPNFSDWRLIAPPFFILIGGIFGGLVWGLYWAISCAFFNMHTGDAFGALALRDYKHFLRMKFEADKVTIYSIKIDKVPDREGWRARLPEDAAKTHKPQIVPKIPLKPELIEPPIEIRAEDVWQRPGISEEPVDGKETEEEKEPVISPGIPG